MAARHVVLGFGLCVSVVACKGPARTGESPDAQPPVVRTDAGTPDPDDLTWVTVPASDTRVQYTGRRYASEAGVVFSHPGVTIRARFWGDAVRMRLNDFGLGDETTTNFFDVSIDDGPPTRLEVRSGQPVYELATGLPVGLHTVEVIKRTETLVGVSEFVALEVHGELHDPPARPGLRMEVVGDSITCGYGSEVSLIPESSSWTAPTFTSKNENVTRGYAWLTARRLGAELVTVCYSGHGVYRNLDMSTSDLIPALYELAVPGRPAVWDARQYAPDVIVVNMGTNDTFAGGGTSAFLPDEAAFKAAYRRFLARLRELHPQARIVCTLGSMTDGYKQQERNGTVTSVHVGDWVTQLVLERNRAGDSRVYRHVMAVQDPNVDGVGEDWHPSPTTHQKMADALTRFIQEQVLR
ncbi:SGNH/GDSL hydrolase family protein [Pyxidicoccus fallax]|uniref:SGNH/GDSL hydrolase family protein n=1 Tax=Pyxidicoccus fallax TaxID=394095 RepID=A0A848LLH4_9BACT|nr:SGNH/GDSL hydrolase family protein [Pyxidicoccus fallax]NMO18608.1 SGNH/GDSL hydrolase family protein [Pyxidicoccus fallax]NPC79149.1 SGNH/GDSL hydrolase family protein [Pyxidicoccus fallax]